MCLYPIVYNLLKQFELIHITLLAQYFDHSSLTVSFLADLTITSVLFVNVKIQIIPYGLYT